MITLKEIDVALAAGEKWLKPCFDSWYDGSNNP